MKQKLYKILVNGKSCHGGDMKWDLPKGNKPGKWHKASGDIEICSNGLHLTNEPFNWYKWGCDCYEAEYKGKIEWEEDKCVVQEARLIKKAKHPKWWTDCEGWIETLKSIAWLKPDGKPKKEWILFETRAAAWDAARDAVRDAAWDAAWDAALFTRTEFICKGLKLENKHRIHAHKRMEVWQKGYGLLCDVQGVLYVYKAI